MPDLIAELVPRMPPLSMRVLENIGTHVRSEFQTSDADALDVVALIDKLATFGIFFYPASALELEDRLGATLPVGEETQILLDSDLWEQLHEGGKRANMARATAIHELSHAVLHMQVLRRHLAKSADGVSLNRVQRNALKPYEDPEWQAWALAGCILAPRARIVAALNAGESTVDDLALHFEVSPGLMQAHLKRLKLLQRGGA